jgi:pyridinium-3,5-biscarboxylic acid mononucleotide synthase
MDKAQIEKLLKEVQQNSLSIEDAVEKLKGMPYEDLDYAKIDNHRVLRCGFSEVVYCPGKTPEQIKGIVERLAPAGHAILLTKADGADFDAARAAAPSAEYREQARLIVIPPAEPVEKIGLVAVISAGTTDIPIAEEAAITAETMGAAVERIYDAGVAGAHRLFAHNKIMGAANAIVAVAGMEGALPSLVGGMVSCPVIAVPTSVGYGASFGGVTALLGMLNSCAAGVSVVNIDNGFGAGYIAATINRQSCES